MKYSIKSWIILSVLASVLFSDPMHAQEPCFRLNIIVDAGLVYGGPCVKCNFQTLWEVAEVKCDASTRCWSCCQSTAHCQFDDPICVFGHCSMNCRCQTAGGGWTIYKSYDCTACSCTQDNQCRS